MKDKVEEQLPGGWRWVNLGAVCEQVRTYDPASEPEAEFTYIDIGSIDNATKQIAEPKKLLGKQAPSRARQLVKANDVLVSTTRPNLNAVALVPEALDNEVCSTGFCVLRANRKLVEPTYLFGFVQSEPFIHALTDLVRGALYPAVTNKQVLSQLICLPPLVEQQQIANRINEQFAALEVARIAAEAQLDTLRKLPTVLLRSAFDFSQNKENNASTPPPPPPPPGIIQKIKSEEWDFVALGEVCDVNPRRSAILERSSDILTTFVPMPAVDERNGVIARPELKPYQEVRKGYTFFEEGDVLFAKITPCMQNGKHAIARNLLDGIGFGSTEFHVLRPGERVAAEWIHFFLRQASVLEAATAHFEGSVGQQRVPADFLRKLQIPLPDLAEQHQLIEALKQQLTAADIARTAAEAQLATLRELPASLLRHTFQPVVA